MIQSIKYRLKIMYVADPTNTADCPFQISVTTNHQLHQRINAFIDKHNIIGPLKIQIKELFEKELKPGLINPQPRDILTILRPMPFRIGLMKTLKLTQKNFDEAIKPKRRPTITGSEHQFTIGFLLADPIVKENMEQLKSTPISSQHQIRKMMQKMQNKRVKLDVRVATMANLRNILKTGINALHISCHGARKLGQNTVLCFERTIESNLSGFGLQQEIQPIKLRQAIADSQAKLSCVTIMACHSGIFKNQLAKLNIPLVVAVDYLKQIDNMASEIFASVFYEKALSLTYQKALQDAVKEVRQHYKHCCCQHHDKDNCKGHNRCTMKHKEVKCSCPLRSENNHQKGCKPSYPEKCTIAKIPNGDRFFYCCCKLDHKQSDKIKFALLAEFANKKIVEKVSSKAVVQKQIVDLTFPRQYWTPKLLLYKSCMSLLQKKVEILAVRGQCKSGKTCFVYKTVRYMIQRTKHFNKQLYIDLKDYHSWYDFELSVKCKENTDEFSYQSNFKGLANLLSELRGLNNLIVVLDHCNYLAERHGTLFQQLVKKLSINHRLIIVGRETPIFQRILDNISRQRRHLQKIHLTYSRSQKIRILLSNNNIVEVEQKPERWDELLFNHFDSDNIEQISKLKPPSSLFDKVPLQADKKKFRQQLTKQKQKKLQKKWWLKMLQLRLQNKHQIQQETQNNLKLYELLINMQKLQLQQPQLKLQNFKSKLQELQLQQLKLSQLKLEQLKLKQQKNIEGQLLLIRIIGIFPNFFRSSIYQSMNRSIVSGNKYKNISFLAAKLSLPQETLTQITGLFREQDSNLQKPNKQIFLQGLSNEEFTEVVVTFVSYCKDYLATILSIISHENEYYNQNAFEFAYDTQIISEQMKFKDLKECFEHEKQNKIVAKMLRYLSKLRVPLVPEGRWSLGHCTEELRLVLVTAPHVSRLLKKSDRLDEKLIHYSLHGMELIPSTNEAYKKGMFDLVCMLISCGPLTSLSQYQILRNRLNLPREKQSYLGLLRGYHNNQIQQQTDLLQQYACSLEQGLLSQQQKDRMWFYVSEFFIQYFSIAKSNVSDQLLVFAESKLHKKLVGCYMNSKVGKDCRFNNCLLRYYLLKNFNDSSFLGSCEELERMVKTMIEDIGRMNKVLELKKNVTKLKKRIEQNAVRIFCARPMIINDIPNRSAIIRRQQRWFGTCKREIQIFNMDLHVTSGILNKANLQTCLSQSCLVMFLRFDVSENKEFVIFEKEQFGQMKAEERILTSDFATQFDFSKAQILVVFGSGISELKIKTSSYIIKVDFKFPAGKPTYESTLIHNTYSESFLKGFIEGLSNRPPTESPNEIIQQAVLVAHHGCLCSLASKTPTAAQLREFVSYEEQTPFESPAFSISPAKTPKQNSESPKVHELAFCTYDNCKAVVRILRDLSREGILVNLYEQTNLQCENICKELFHILNQQKNVEVFYSTDYNIQQVLAEVTTRLQAGEKQTTKRTFIVAYLGEKAEQSLGECQKLIKKMKGSIIIGTLRRINQNDVVSHCIYTERQQQEILKRVYQKRQTGESQS